VRLVRVVAVVVELRDLVARLDQLGDCERVVVALGSVALEILEVALLADIAGGVVVDRVALLIDVQLAVRGYYLAELRAVERFW
jgi:hypothetical protein